MQQPRGPTGPRSGPTEAWWEAGVMAKVNDRAIPWFAVRALERSAGGRYSAGDIYPDLDAEPGAQRRAQQQRQRVDSEIANLGRIVRDGVPDENPPRVQPRARITEGETARASDMRNGRKTSCGHGALSASAALRQSTLIGGLGKGNDMDYLDGFVVETEKARDTAVTVFNNFTAILKGMREQLTRVAEEVDRRSEERR